MASTYTYKLNKACELWHMILSSEKEHGVQAFIFKDCKKIKEEFLTHAPIIDLLYADKPDAARDVVFLQVSPPGKTFAKYSEDKHKLCMTLGAYLDLLKFFRNDYTKMSKKMDTDMKLMGNKSDWLSLNPFISFRGPADIYFKLVLETTPHHTFELTITKEYDTGNLLARLVYSEDKMGSISLPLATIKTMSRDLPTINDLVDYKETGPNKRQRQS